MSIADNHNCRLAWIPISWLNFLIVDLFRFGLFHSFAFGFIVATLSLLLLDQTCSCGTSAFVQMILCSCWCIYGISVYARLMAAASAIGRSSEPDTLHSICSLPGARWLPISSCISTVVTIAGFCTAVLDRLCRQRYLCGGSCMLHAFDRLSYPLLFTIRLKFIIIWSYENISVISFLKNVT